MPGTTTTTDIGLPMSRVAVARKRFAIIGSRGFPSTYGGYETLVRHLARYLHQQGHDVTVYCREPRDGQRSWMDEGIHCVATRGYESKSLSTLTFGATSMSHAAFRRYDAALVLNIANGFWLPALRARGVPFTVNTDGLEWKRAKWSGLGKFVFKKGAQLTAKWSPSLVCDSQALQDVWKDEFDRESEFIPYGGELRGPLADAQVRALGLEPGRYALAVARLVPENNVELTLDSIDHLGGTAPQLVVVGSANYDTPLTERLETMVDQGRVIWLGHVSDQELLAELWQHAGVYLHGHSVGGTNPALLQALGAGAPTLALDTVFNREVLVADEHLYQHDAAELADRIASLCFGPAAARVAFAERGQAIVTGKYTWDDVCKRYSDLLTSLADSKSGAASSSSRR